MDKSILNGVGKKMRFAYLNGKISDEEVLARYQRNKKEADSFSCFGYRRSDILDVLKECFNPLLKEKLQSYLKYEYELEKKSYMQNHISLKKLAYFKTNACGIGLRKVIKRLKQHYKKTKDKDLQLVLMVLETEFANLTAKRYTSKYLRRRIYARKTHLLCRMAQYLEKQQWKYGVNCSAGKNANFLVFVYLPNGVQLTWHANEFAVYELYPTTDDTWDGQICMTLEKIFTYIETFYKDLLL